MKSYFGPWGSVYVFVRDMAWFSAALWLYFCLKSLSRYVGFNANGLPQETALGAVVGTLTLILLFWIVADGVRIFLRLIMTAPSIQS